MRFTTLSNYHLADWWCDVNSFCLLDDLILSFCCSNLTKETGGLELALTITLELQANQLTKCASHPHNHCSWNGLKVSVDHKDDYDWTVDLGENKKQALNLKKQEW